MDRASTALAAQGPLHPSHITSLSVSEPLLVLAQCFWAFYPKILHCTNLKQFLEQNLGILSLLPAKRVGSKLALTWIAVSLYLHKSCISGCKCSSGFILVYSQTPQT